MTGGGPLVERTAIAAAAGGDPAEVGRGLKFSGHSLRASLASSAEVDERCKSSWGTLRPK